MNDFNLDITLKKIDAYAQENYSPDKGKRKVFYSWYEWSGFGFYLKAFWYRDWPTIKSHITREYFSPKDPS